MVTPVGLEHQMLELWMQQHQASLEVSQECVHELERISQRESELQKGFNQAAEKAQACHQKAGWWGLAERITRIAGSAVAIARGGWRGAACAGGLLAMEAASASGTLQRWEQQAAAHSPAAATAVRVGIASASIGLGAYSLYQGAGAGGIGGVLQGCMAVGSGISAVGRGTLEAQSKYHEAEALDHQAALLQLSAAREQLQQRIEREATRREQLAAQMQESLACWDINSSGDYS